MRSILVGIASALLVSCKSTASSPSAGEAAAVSATPSLSASAETPQGPPTDKEVPTTSGEIALGNLTAQLSVAESDFAARPKDLDVRSKLVELLATRADATGSIGDLTRSAELGRGAVELHPDVAQAFRMRARAETTLHRFSAALTDLDAAERHGLKAAELAGDRATIFHALGRYDEALVIRKRQAESNPGLRSLGLYAALLSDMGQHTAADEGFAKAVRSYRDVSPFPVAWLLFHHGTALEKSGQVPRAKEMFQAAVARMPMHAHARIHLAALEPPAAGLAWLAPIADKIDDPEVWALQAQLFAKTSRADDAAQAKQRAAKQFEALGRDFPEAFADHLARFALGPGNEPGTALRWAAKNLELRKTSESYQLALEAAVKAGKSETACEYAEASATLPHATGRLQLARADAFVHCGKPERAEEARAEARKLALLR
ncbi:MAG: hypothetical protein IPI67_04820 [Myxococcales bacterium]|nr:hypothetical protein [Myxococcales bacterium]